MLKPIDVVLGFDPGGRGRGRTVRKFGWCICQSEPEHLWVYRTGRATNAEDALKQVSYKLPPGARVIASGIDAPMFWTNTGERMVDNIIRAAGQGNGCPNPEHHPPAKIKWCPYPLNVQQINSLWGACLAQGVLLGRLLHGSRRFDAPITETHPKALLCLLGICRAGLGQLVPGVVERIPCPTCRPDPDNPVQVANNRPCPAEDEEDAVLSVYASWHMLQELRDPARDPVWRDLLREERHYVLPFGTPVSYWMPIL